jgi:hypothetical protein
MCVCVCVYTYTHTHVHSTFRVVAMFVTVSLQTISHTCNAGTFMIFLHTKFNFPNSNWSYVSVIKSKDTKIFTLQPCCYFIFYKSATSANGAYFSKFDSHITFQGLWYLVLVSLEPPKFANSPRSSD